MSPRTRKEKSVFCKRTFKREEITLESINNNKKMLALNNRLRRIFALPDLVVNSYSTSYSAQDYIINTNIKNRGSRKSNPSRVYCNAISLIPIPGINDIRKQETADLPEIMPGASVDRVFKFKIVDLDNGEVGKIEILVDPKNEVVESNEINNTERFNWPT